MRGLKRQLRRQCPAIGSVLVVMVLLLAATSPAQAQSFSTADLAGTWSLFQLSTPATVVTGAAVRSYSGSITFNASGAVTSGTVTDDLLVAHTVTGSLTISAAGLVDGTLSLDGGPGHVGSLDVQGARLLASRFTIAGASIVFDSPGLFTLVKTDGGQTFSLNQDVATDGDGNGNYTYHEITPVDQGVSAAEPGDANWSSGSITFHETDGCTAADLVRADGTVRAQRSDGATSFG
jgi:hypothetical protein